jgi:hypothetical protein
MGSFTEPSFLSEAPPDPQFTFIIAANSTKREMHPSSKALM